MKIIHFSDSHEAASPEGWRAYLDKRLLGALNYRLSRRSLHDNSLLDRAVEFILSEKPDAAVCTGDICSCGQRSEFERAIKRLKPLLESNIPFLYVPGNHDAYVRDISCRKALEAAFSTLNSGRLTLDALPSAIDIGECRFILINCARPTPAMMSCGFATKETVEFARRECELQKHSPRILVGHFPLLERHPMRRVRHRLYGAKPIAGMLKEGLIDLSLCGHVHAPYGLLDERGRGESCAGSLTRFGMISTFVYDASSDAFTLTRTDLRGR